MLPIVIVSIEIAIGNRETINRPTPKKAVKIIPITTSLLSPERSFKNNITEAANPPEINAPAANGIPIK